MSRAANPLCNNMKVTVCENAHEATEQGYVYTQPEYLPIEVKEVVVVLKGTVRQNSTVDFLLEDSNGQKYMFMITGNLLKSIPC